METAIRRIEKKNKDYMLAELLDEILERHQQPEDRYEVAALLESLGWNDDRAAETFGADNVFDLADQLWARIKTRVLYTPFSKVEKMSARQLMMSFAQNFFRGMIFALPMAVSVFSMLSLKFSLWSYQNLSVEFATSIAIGTILSFITVGGFTQAIARRGFFYIIQGYYNMARRITFYFIGTGFLVCVVLSGLILLLNMIVQMFPLEMLTIIVLYFFFLNTIWLSVTVMYILKKEILFTVLIILGICSVYVMFVMLGMNIIVSQLIALSLVSIISLILVIYFFKAAERKAEKGISPKLPKLSVTIYSTLPYFIYGILYFSFLFVDRIIAWSTNNAYMPYLIWFRGNYELGLDFALLVLIIPMGMSEVVLSKLMSDIEVSQKNYWGDETSVMNRHFFNIYIRIVAIIAIISMSSAIVLYTLTYWILDYYNLEIGTTLFTHEVTHTVFVVSLIAYVFVAVALMNAVILFSLSQPGLVIKSILPALIVNISIGFLLSRWFGFNYDWGYSCAVYGLLAGSIVFMILSILNVTKVLRKLDYYLYAAS